MGNLKIDDQYRAKNRFWQTHIRVWAKSGLSQNEYCRRNKLKANQFCYWKKKLKSAPKGITNFVPVTVQPQKTVDNGNNPDDSGLTITFDQITIKLENDFNPSVLATVVSALGGKS